MNVDLNLLETMPKSIAVAWSGGADSTALVFQLLDHGFEVQLWHVDHGWSEQSAETARILEKQAGLWGLPFRCERIEKTQGNIEAEARKGRYQAFEAMAVASGCGHIVLGHHADDQAETVCMRLLQGAGVAGCQGMKPSRKQRGLWLYRPLLQATRQSIEQYLIHKGVRWVDDPSNHNTEIWRNKIRHKFFPTLERMGVSPQALFLRWQAQANRVQAEIEAQADGIDVKHWQEQGIDVCEIAWDIWFAQEHAVRVYLLQKMIGTLFADGSVFGRRHILAIEAWRQHGGHGWLNLSGCCLYRHEQGLQLCQGKASLRNRLSNSAQQG